MSKQKKMSKQLETPFLTYENFQAGCEELATWLEGHWNVSIDCDYAVLEECYLRSKMSVEHIRTERLDPNCVKKGGILMYWISRLKPFRLWSWEEVREQLALKDSELAKKLPVDSRNPKDYPFSCKLYLNEIIGVLIGRCLAENLESARLEIKYSISMRPSTFHDLVIGLRYFSHSPHVCNMILDASMKEVEKASISRIIDNIDRTQV